MIDVKIKRLSDSATMPTYGSEKAACMDLYACTEDVVIQPHTVTKIGIGLAFAPLEGYMLQILQRSGLASKGIFPMGGIVDEDYRGEVLVALYNSTDKPYIVHHKDRIAQMAVRRYYQANLVEVEELDSTNRGEKGFGSSGK